MQEPTVLDCMKESYALTISPGENKYLVPGKWRNEGDGIMNFKSKPGDVWIMTLPRCGTTLTQEMVWILSNDLDFETAKKFPLEERVPEITASLFPRMWENAESCRMLVRNPNDPKKFESIPCDTSKPSYEEYSKIPSPRFFKTHFPFSVHKDLLTSGAKTIYVARDPRDRLVSTYRFWKSVDFNDVEGDFKDFWERAKKENLVYTQVWSHLKEGWSQQNHPNVLFLFYEDMRMNLPAVIKKVSAFLGKSYTDDQIEAATSHLDIDYFRKNPMVNKLAGFPEVNSLFIGQGKVGGYKDLIPPEIEHEINEWIAENLRIVNIPFPTLKKK